jgi:acyl-CoA thioesterase I
MNPFLWQLIWYVADGTSFFVGAATLLLAVIFSSLAKVKWKNFIVYPLVIIAASEILLSASPLALWFYILWSLAIIVWLIVCGRPSISEKTKSCVQIVVACLCCIAIAIELPYHLTPQIPKGNSKMLYVIGDSVSAGVGGVREMQWPMILGKEHNVNVINLAIVGATAKSAIKQATQVQEQNAVVFVEIGGNDILAPTPTKEFETSLEQILKIVTNPTRTVIMLELPLLPLQNEYGRIQRNLAEKYDAILVPKRYFAGILSSNGDIHLSQSGHALMAEKVWSIIHPMMEP